MRSGHFTVAITAIVTILTPVIAQQPQIFTIKMANDGLLSQIVAKHCRNVSLYEVVSLSSNLHNRRGSLTDPMDVQVYRGDSVVFPADRCVTDVMRVESLTQCANKSPATTQIGLGMDFWQHHGWLFLIAMALFPRITMLVVGTVSSFGLLGWLGWVFVPHLTVAILATTIYWHTNPILCIVAWIIALGGTGLEAQAARSL